MDEKVNIGVIEDERMTAEILCRTLDNFGYNTSGVAGNYSKALKMIEDKKPDILLIDIFLDGKKDGIDLSETINENYNIPIIFLTSNTNKETFERAKKVNPQAFLIKPFNSEDLRCSIEICLNGVSKNRETNSNKMKSSQWLKDTVFIKEGNYFQKVMINDVYYIESEAPKQIGVHLFARKMNIGISLEDCIENLDKDVFCRINRHTLVNINYVESITADYVTIKGEKIQSNRKYLNEILHKFRIL